MSQGYQWFAAFDLKIFKSSNWKVVLVLDKQDEIPHQLKVESKTLLKTHDGSLVKGVSVTKKSDGLFDFVSRYFAPWVSHSFCRLI